MNLCKSTAALVLQSPTRPRYPLRVILQEKHHHALQRLPKCPQYITALMNMVREKKTWQLWDCSIRCNGLFELLTIHECLGLRVIHHLRDGLGRHFLFLLLPVLFRVIVQVLFLILPLVQFGVLLDCSTFRRGLAEEHINWKKKVYIYLHYT